MPDNAAPMILLTRPAAQAARFARACRDALGTSAGIVIAPMQDIALLPLPPIPQDAALIFTSENGVAAYRQGGGAEGLTAYCVGDRTAQAAEAAGLDARSAQGAADDLVALVRASTPTGPLMHLHGTHVRGNIIDRLAGTGFDASGHVVYDQRVLPLSQEAIRALSGTRRVLVPLFSPRSAALFAKALPPTSQPDLICISAATRDALPPALQTRTSLAEAPTGAAMLKALARQLSP